MCKILTKESDNVKVKKKKCFLPKDTIYILYLVFINNYLLMMIALLAGYYYKNIYEAPIRNHLP